MCELFAMSSLWPATVNLSLGILAQHGGGDGPHRDGWGVAFYEENDARIIRDTGPAFANPWVSFVESLDLTSAIVLAHIRKATSGAITLRNTHPFSRELGGQMHVFAHNGKLDGLRSSSAFSLGWHRPIGETDSEHAFCALLQRLAGHWLNNSRPPSLETRFEIVSQFAFDLRKIGVANFLYSDGEALFAHSHRRMYGSEIRPPGLHMLHRSCSVAAPATMSGVRISGPQQDVLLFASVPLTAEDWMPLVEGEVVVAAGGQRVLTG